MALSDFVKAGRPRVGQWVEIDGTAFGHQDKRVRGIIAGDMTLHHEMAVNEQGVPTHRVRRAPGSRYLMRLKQNGILPKSMLDRMSESDIATFLKENFEEVGPVVDEIMAKPDGDARDKLLVHLKKAVYIPVGFLYQVDIVHPETGETIDSWAAGPEHLVPMTDMAMIPKDRATSPRAVLRP